MILRRRHILAVLCLVFFTLIQQAHCLELTACCLQRGVSIRCLPALCNVSSISKVPESCYDDFLKAAKCFGGTDYSACCVDHGVSGSCVRMCNGTISELSGVALSACMSLDIDTLYSCVKSQGLKAVEVVPSTTPQPLLAACKQPKLVGRCKAAIPRWYFNGTACEEFTYGGCAGNDNNFLNKTACTQKCVGSDDESAENSTFTVQSTPIVPNTPYLCPGNVSAFVRRGSVVQASSCSDLTCPAGFACYGTDSVMVCCWAGNSFPGPTGEEPFFPFGVDARVSDWNDIRCYTPKPPLSDAVRAVAPVQAWYYNQQRRTCMHIILYGAPQDHYFLSAFECETSCMNGTQTDFTQFPCLDGSPSLTFGGRALFAEQCADLLCPSDYICYENRDIARCCRFRYVAEIIDNQPLSALTTQTPLYVGPQRCDAPKSSGYYCKNDFDQTHSETRYYFDEDRQMCLAFDYKGCGANSNNFANKRDCELQCLMADGGVCAGNNPFYTDESGEGLTAASCELLNCPEGYVCGRGWAFVACCNETIEEYYSEAFTGYCPGKRQPYKINYNDYSETLLGRSCIDLPCPSGYDCFEPNGLFAKCCPSDLSVQPFPDDANHNGSCSEEDIQTSLDECSPLLANISTATHNMDLTNMWNVSITNGNNAQLNSSDWLVILNDTCTILRNFWQCTSMQPCLSDSLLANLISTGYEESCMPETLMRLAEYQNCYWNFAASVTMRTCISNNADKLLLNFTESISDSEPLCAYVSSMWQCIKPPLAAECGKDAADLQETMFTHVFSVAAKRPCTLGSVDQPSSIGESRPCEKHVKRLTSSVRPLIGAYTPQCTDDGMYSEVQCHGSTGYCWCVYVVNGTEVENTRVAPGKGPPSCSAPSTTTPPVGACWSHKQRIVGSTGQPSLGAYVPQCKDDGTYELVQCHGSTGYCWCVDTVTGIEVPLTRVAPGKGPPSCSIPSTTTPPVGDCLSHQQRIAGSTGQPLLGAYVPQCKNDGTYELVQCHGSTGYCWCVDTITGIEVPLTRVGPQDGPPVCLKTACQDQRDSLLSAGAPPGAFVPTCSEDGSYETTQCHGSTGYCWCVDKANGTELVGTRMGPSDSKPLCGTPRRACLVSNEKVLPIGAYKPQCDENGLFKEVQCHGSTGYCFCVDPQSGDEIEGTRVGPGSLRPTCGKPVCLAHQERLLGSGPAPPGAYVPQCTQGGLYDSTQCHGSTGYCWCVWPETGEEINGTRVPPGNSPNCFSVEQSIDDNSNFVGCTSSEAQALLTCAGPINVLLQDLGGIALNSTNNVSLLGSFSFPSLSVLRYISLVNQSCEIFTQFVTCANRVLVSETCNPLPVHSVEALEFFCRPDTQNSLRADTSCLQSVMSHEGVLQCLQRIVDSHVAANTNQSLPTDSNLCTLVKQQYDQCLRNPLTKNCNKEAVNVATKLSEDVVKALLNEPCVLSDAATQQTKCVAHRDALLQGQSQFFGSYIPQCGSSGNYAPVQCHGSTGYCWCVDEVSGVKIAGTDTPPGKPPQCGECHTQRQRAMLQIDQDVNSVGVYIPQCQPNGRFQPLQCNPAGQCWCVNESSGAAIGSQQLVANGVPQCTTQAFTCERLLAPDVCVNATEHGRVSSTAYFREDFRCTQYTLLSCPSEPFVQQPVRTKTDCERLCL